MIVAYDTETYEQKGEHLEPILNSRKFVIGCSQIQNKQPTYHYDHKKMWEYFKKLIEKNKQDKKRTFIYAHNAIYDLYAILQDQILEEISNGNLVIVRTHPLIAIYKEKGYFLDTLSFYNNTLENIGKKLDFRKGKMPTKIKHPIELIPYVTRDTQIVLKAVQTLKEQLQSLGYNPRKLMTSGQLAMTSFLTYIKRNGLERTITSYDPEKKRAIITPTQYEKNLREAFRGARNQDFQTGTYTNTTYIDINSLYPYIMSTMKIPDTKTETYYTKPTKKMFYQLINRKLGIAQIKIKSAKKGIGILPIRYSEKQHYTNNTILIGTWTFNEIKTAINNGYKLLDIKWAISYEQQQKNPFKKYLQEMYELRKQNKQLNTTIKLLMNNLFGKFGQKPRTNYENKIIYRSELLEYQKQGWEYAGQINDRYFIKKPIGTYTATYTNPIFSLMITANARLYLYKHLTKIPEEDLLYCDTDSIIFKGNHINKFKISNKMGDFKIEHQNVPSVFRGEKKYSIGQHVKISGVPKKDSTIQSLQHQTVIHTKRRITHTQALRTGKPETIGTFTNTKIHITTKAKKDQILPSYINETTEKLKYNDFYT